MSKRFLQQTEEEYTESLKIQPSLKKYKINNEDQSQPKFQSVKVLVNKSLTIKKCEVEVSQSDY